MLILCSSIYAYLWIRMAWAILLPEKRFNLRSIVYLSVVILHNTCISAKFSHCSSIFTKVKLSVTTQSIFLLKCRICAILLMIQMVLDVTITLFMRDQKAVAVIKTVVTLFVAYGAHTLMAFITVSHSELFQFIKTGNDSFVLLVAIM